MKTRLLFVEDDDTFRSVLQRELEGFGHEVFSFGTAEAALEFIKEKRVDVALLDLKLPGISGLELLDSVTELSPGTPVVFLTGHGSLPDAVKAMRAGAYDFLVKPARLDELDLTLQRAIEYGRLRKQNRLLRTLVDRGSSSEILGVSREIVALRSAIERVGASDANVLVTGENGTGKELAARAIHDASPRSGASFVVVNCGAIPDELFESELFGHRRGAFTGADRKRLGLIELADGGTLFLDEIGELPLAVQPALLRAVQFGEFRPVGAEQSEHVDVRVVAATNRDLAEAIRQKEFREDLYHRIAILNVEVPPLRDRENDVQYLARTFLDRYNETAPPHAKKQISSTALDRLASQRWTGNVRELENVVVRLVTLVDSPMIEPEHVDQHVLRNGSRDPSKLTVLDLATLERSAVLQALELHQGHRERAAAELGVAVKTLYNKIRQHGIEADEWAH